MCERGPGARSSTNRYFPERSDLIDAISADALERVSQAMVRARIDDGPAPEALARVCQEFFEFGDLFMLLFTMPDLLAKEEWHEESDDDRALLRLIERGHQQGTVDSSLPSVWVMNLLWSVLYTAWEQVREAGTPKHEALTLCLRTLAKAIAP